MNSVGIDKIQELYRECGIHSDEANQNLLVRNKISKGTLNNLLNADFTNVYGKVTSFNLGNMTIVR